MNLSVAICTYNPKLEILEKLLDGLKRQQFDHHLWELIVVDNCSAKPLAEAVAGYFLD